RPAVGRWIAATALAVALFEMWPFPGTRDVLPTSAHRWLATRTGPVRVLDCVEPTEAEGSVPWLMGKELRPIEKPFEGCDEPQLPSKLAALGINYLIVRSSAPAPWPPSAVPDGLEVANVSPDARVYGVRATASPLIVIDSNGFYGWEGDGPDRWRWMGQEGEWTIANMTGRPLRATLNVALQSYA